MVGKPHLPPCANSTKRCCTWTLRYIEGTMRRTRAHKNQVRQSRRNLRHSATAIAVLWSRSRERKSEATHTLRDPPCSACRMQPGRIGGHPSGKNVGEYEAQPQPAWKHPDWARLAPGARGRCGHCGMTHLDPGSNMKRPLPIQCSRLRSRLNLKVAHNT